ncbi:MAG: hypothetical protein QM669_15610 [Siphonobacter sp.]
MHLPPLCFPTENAWPTDLLMPSTESTITQEENYQDQLIRLHYGLDRLPNRQREAIMLAFFDNITLRHQYPIT